MTHRAIIVDDERLARVVLRKLLEERDDVEVVGEASSVDEAAGLLREHKPDVVFLDVQMPGGSGFELFERADVQAQVIFVTAYDQHAVRAFEVNALDYLVKPVDPKQLDRALGRVPPGQREEEGLESALQLDDVVCLHEGQRMKFATTRDIAIITAADDYTEVHLGDGQASLVSVPLRVWERRLPESHFVRIHRSTLVNLHFVDEVLHEDDGWLVGLRGLSQRLAMSRRYAQSLKKRLGVPGR